MYILRIISDTSACTDSGALVGHSVFPFTLLAVGLTEYERANVREGSDRS